MTASDGLFALMKDVLLFRENMGVIRTAMAGLTDDVARLADDHVALSQRVARIEGFIEGAAAAGPRRARLPKA